MQSASWIALFRRIPANLHDGLILSLTTGAEVVVQRFVKLDTDVVILRGRMAGTQDNGRVVILPYCNLISVNFTRRMSEAEVESIFGKNAHAFAANIVLSAAANADSDAAESSDDASSDAPAASAPSEAAGTSTKPTMPSKTMLIAKLRARLNESNRAGG